MKNIFVIGLEPFNLELLQTIDQGRAYRFHSLFDYDEIVHTPEVGYPSLASLLAKADKKLAGFPGGADAVIGYWDFPTSVLAPMIANRQGWPGPSLEAVARCEHKFWSRLAQQEVVPRYLPPFQVIDPFRPDPVADVRISYPFWIKPIKAHSSFLGFHIDSAETLRDRLETIREKIHLMGEPFNEFLEHVSVPAAVGEVDGCHCIAEEIISAGVQCTVEGYAWNGEMYVLGIVDSVRGGKHRSCFTRYQYPSKLPRRVQRQIAAISKRVMRHLQYDGAAFNVEFFWDRKQDQLRLLEINSRISKSHSPLFLMVDGATNQKVTLELALGQRPEFPSRAGEHRLAAKFMLRFFEDGILERIPDEDDLARLNDRYPEARVRLLAGQETRLSELKFQDSYSFEVAEIFLGGDTQKQLLDKYQQACEILDFQVRPLEMNAA